MIRRIRRIQSMARGGLGRRGGRNRLMMCISFLALYESAQEIVQLVKQLVIYHPSLVARW
jgi:hypothetical protein